MPTPYSAMAALAAELGDLDRHDETAVESFYVTVYPAFTQKIREDIFAWLASFDHEVETDELAHFVSQLRERPDFRIVYTNIVSGVPVAAAADGRTEAGAALIAPSSAVNF